MAVKGKKFNQVVSYNLFDLTEEEAREKGDLMLELWQEHKEQKELEKTEKQAV